MEEQTPITKKLVIYDDLEIRQALAANDCLSLLWDFKQWLRSEIKYQDKDYEPIRERLGELMEEYGINLEKLYS